MNDSDSLFRLIPSVEAILQSGEMQELLRHFPRDYVAQMLKELFHDWRKGISTGRLEKEELEESLRNIRKILEEKIERERASTLVRLINATGVIIHTNLGRSPLPRNSLEGALTLASRYCSLEYDLESGERGRRDIHAEQALKRLLGAEACTVVNNNAAAVLIVLSSLAEGMETIVSRGELVEIGGSFRIPDIMRRSGSVLAEVGTTNRTKLSDYESRISEKTGLILKVHLSNYRIVGFTESVPLPDLVALGRRMKIPVAEDQGTGSVIDLSTLGIRDEHTVQETLSAGVDVVTFSGDKILGGPQAGIIAGKKEFVDRIRRNPFFRVVRPCKVTLSLLHAVLRLYIEGKENEIPVVRMFRLGKEEIKKRAERFVASLGVPQDLICSLEEGESMFGGGTVPLRGLPTVLISVTSARLSASQIESALRKHTPPVISRIAEDKVLIDLRTVDETEEEILKKALYKIFSAGGS